MEINIPGTPTGRNILVKMDEVEEITAEGIALPTSAITLSLTGTVVKLGPQVEELIGDSPHLETVFPKYFGLGCRLLLMDGVQSEVTLPEVEGRFMLVDDSDIALVLVPEEIDDAKKHNDPNKCSTETSPL